MSDGASSTGSGPTGPKPSGPSRIVLFKSGFQYGAINIFVDGLARGFAGLGYRTDIVQADADEDQVRADLRAALAQPQDVFAVVGAGGTLCDLGSGGQNLYVRLGVPYVAYITDHPSYALQRLSRGGNLVVTCVDRQHVPFLQAAGFRHVHFVPHGADPPAAPPPPFAARTQGMMLAATAADPGPILAECLEEREGIARDLFRDIATREDLATMADVEAALDADPRTAQVPDLARFSGTRIIWLNDFERLIRLVRRLALVKALDRPGTALDLFGKGWDAFGFAHHRAHGPVPFDQILALHADYRFTLHPNPLFTESPHERPLYAALAGSVVVTDGNPLLRALLPFGKAAIGFDPAEPDWPAQLAARLTDRGTDFQAIADEGRRIVAEGHTWAHRAAAIVEAVKAFTA